MATRIPLICTPQHHMTTAESPGVRQWRHPATHMRSCRSPESLKMSGPAPGPTAAARRPGSIRPRCRGRADRGERRAPPPAGGRFVFHVFGALAKFERDLIRERTPAGLVAARGRGQLGGRPRKVADPVHLELARTLFAGRRTSPRSAPRSGSRAPHSSTPSKPSCHPDEGGISALWHVRTRDPRSFACGLRMTQLLRHCTSALNGAPTRRATAL